MTDVPSNLIPTRITQLPDAPVASPDGLLLFVYQGNSYKVRAGDLLSVAGVPTSRQVIAGTALTGGGALSSDVTISVANNGIGTTQLANSGVSSGTYGDATNIPVFTVDATGRVTAATTIAVNVSGYVPVARQVIAGTGLTGGGTLNNDVTLNANLASSLPVVGDVNGVSGVATTISRSDHQHPSVDLADNTQVNGLLGLQHGGTAKSLVADAGAIIWSGADGLYVGPVGLAGQVLISGGTSAPIWGSALVISDQPANVVYAGPTSGPNAPSVFRSLVNADLPTSGVAANTYGSSTKVPVITLNSKGVVTTVTESTIIGTISYQGAWNANTNFPVLTSSVGTNGFYYIVTTAGTTNLNGITDWQIGDWAIFNGTVWQKIDQTNTVVSVNGQTGVVNVGTVTSVDGTGTVNGLTLTGSVSTSGSLTLGGTLGSIANNQLSNSAITINGNAVSLGGSTTVTATATNALTIGTGLSGTSYNGSTTVTIANTGVLSVSATAPVASSGGANPNISMASATTSVDGYLTSTDWTTFNNKQAAFASQTANYVYAAPNGSAGVPSFRALDSADFPVSGVTANTYGSATLIPVVTVNSKGVITSATTVSVSAGTVTSASVVSANGFTGTVATATTTPAITLATSVTGVLKGNGTALSAATLGTDYSLGTSALSTGIIKSTTTTGALTIAVAADFPTLNQNTTGTAAGLSTTLVIGSGGTGTINGINGGTF